MLNATLSDERAVLKAARLRTNDMTAPKGSVPC